VIHEGTATRSHGGRQTLPGTAPGALLRSAGARARATSSGQTEAQAIRGRAHGRTFGCSRRRAIAEGRHPGPKKSSSFDEAAVEAVLVVLRSGIHVPFTEGRDRGCQRLGRDPAARSKKPPEKWGASFRRIPDQGPQVRTGQAARETERPTRDEAEAGESSSNDFHSIASPTRFRPGRRLRKRSPGRKRRAAVIRESSGPIGYSCRWSVAEVG
jgi:hypothetical protein